MMRTGDIQQCRIRHAFSILFIRIKLCKRWPGIYFILFNRFNKHIPMGLNVSRIFLNSVRGVISCKLVQINIIVFNITQEFTIVMLIKRVTINEHLHNMQ